MEAKTDITFGCPFKTAVVNNYKSTENPHFPPLPLHSLNFSLAVTPPSIFGDHLLVKAVDFGRMF
jgi:hypothetical protein